MTNNVGGLDRAARIVIGALLVILALAGTIGAWGWIGVVPLLLACSEIARSTGSSA